MSLANKVVGHPLFLWGIGALGLFAAAYCYSNFRSAQEAEEQRKNPKKETAIIAPKEQVNPQVKQPVDMLDPGGPAIEFHSLPRGAPASPEATPPPEKAEKWASLILVSNPAPPKPPSPPPPKAENASHWLPPGRFIQCSLQNDLDSSHMDGPVEGKVTENVFTHNDGKGVLIIPAGSVIIAMANGGYVRDRIQVSGSWRIVFQASGRSVEFSGIACDREFDPALNQWGPEDKTAGIRGVLYESDHYVRLKGLIGLVTSTATQAVGQLGSAALQSSTGNNMSFSNLGPEGARITDQYIQMLLNGHHTSINDTLFVHIPGSKPFYVFNRTPIDLGKQERGGEVGLAPKDIDVQNPISIFDPKMVQKALDYNQEQLKAAYEKDNNPPK